jgi:hypothetical protein
LEGAQHVDVKLLVHYVMHLSNVDGRARAVTEQRRGLQERVAHAFWLLLDDDLHLHRADLPGETADVVRVFGVANDDGFGEAERLITAKLADEQRFGAEAQEGFFAQGPHARRRASGENDEYGCLSHVCPRCAWAFNGVSLAQGCGGHKARRRKEVVSCQLSVKDSGKGVNAEKRRNGGTESLLRWRWQRQRLWLWRDPFPNPAP